MKYISTTRRWSHKKYSSFDFSAHLVFTFDVFWSSLGTSIFGIFPFLMTMVQIRKSNMTSYISDILDVLKFHLLCLFFFQISCYDLFFVLDLKHVFIEMFWEGIWKSEKSLYGFSTNIWRFDQVSFQT